MLRKVRPHQGIRMMVQIFIELAFIMRDRSSDTMKNAIQRAVPVAPRYQINLLQLRIYQFHLERKKDVTVVWTDLSLKTPADSFTLAVLEKS